MPQTQTQTVQTERLSENVYVTVYPNRDRITGVNTNDGLRCVVATREIAEMETVSFWRVDVVSDSKYLRTTWYGTEREIRERIVTCILSYVLLDNVIRP